MKLNKFIGLLILVHSCVFFVSQSLAADLSCNELKSSINMARSNSTKALNEYRAAAGDSYRAKVIFAFKYFELNRHDTRAERQLFDALPDNDKQYSIWTTMGDSFCDDESLADMKLLDKFSTHFSRLMSEAVMANPNYMQRYVEFSMEAAQDPHSDFALQMQRVCFARHDALEKAVEGLSIAAGHWFNSHVMRVDNCKPLALPESE